ncbi:hypothetical protein TrLO_g5502 [Triparma laevis f. longispina]|uniref:Uncharacterized protein n=1 Tax=Triparma laevis f. longispina TaxID=1714387 RepID=A0A9W7FGF9_9STRA|nr:hypothetical protein TrLO_g5502 [Triparma laevis f. longispina]
MRAKSEIKKSNRDANSRNCRPLVLFIPQFFDSHSLLPSLPCALLSSFAVSDRNSIRSTLNAFNALEAHWKHVRSNISVTTKTQPLQNLPCPFLLPYTPSPTSSSMSLNPFSKIIESPKAPTKNKSAVCLGLGLEGLA